MADYILNKFQKLFEEGRLKEIESLFKEEKEIPPSVITSFSRRIIQNGQMEFAGWFLGNNEVNEKLSEEDRLRFGKILFDGKRPGYSGWFLRKASLEPNVIAEFLLEKMKRGKAKDVGWFLVNYDEEINQFKPDEVAHLSQNMISNNAAGFAGWFLANYKQINKIEKSTLEKLLDNLKKAGKKGYVNWIKKLRSDF